MGLRWIFLNLLFAHAVDAFSTIDNSNQLIIKNTGNQLQLASKIQI